jgi:hypothetical protein
VSHYMFTDACLAPLPCVGVFAEGGFASLDLRQLLSLGLSPPDASLDINHWECYGVLLALQLFSSVWARSRVIIFCDNMATVEWLSSGSARPPTARLLVQQVFTHCVDFHIRLHVQHIAGEQNVLADALSRKQWSRFAIQAQELLSSPSAYLSGLVAAV